MIKKLGIWMDHSSAHLIECTFDPIITKYIESKFTHETNEDSMEKNELLMHNKEQQSQSDYYMKLGEVIAKYQEVLLFGPTDAKNELYNLLKNEQQFKSIKIALKVADKMTLPQQHAYVKEYFSNSEKAPF